jgi:hypothetical protein
LEPRQFVVNRLVDGYIRTSYMTVKRFEVALQKASVKLKLEVARSAHRAIVREPNFARDSDVQSHRHDLVSPIGL